MQFQPLKRLGERLLRAGVAHRHVRRYMSELHDHYEDALREELAKGLDRTLAEQAAWKRLGSEEELARSVLAQPALRSTAARFPALVFGAAPVLTWFVSFALIFYGLALADFGWWVLGSMYALFLLYMRVLPVILGVVLLIASARQRTAPHWPIVGTAIVALIGGTTGVVFTLGSTPQASLVGINSSLLPMIFRSSAWIGRPNALALAGGVARSALMLGMATTPYVIWQIRQRRSSMTS
jgi:hypothetical protein